MGYKNERAGDCTTPAQNTEEIPMRVLVDWVTASFKSAMDLQFVFNFIGIGDLSNLESYETSKFAKGGYESTHKIGMVEFHRSEKNGRWLLNMSGQGCRQFEVLSSMDIETMLAVLVNVNTTFTRIDIAIDDFGGIFKTNTIRQAVYNKCCVTFLEDWGNGERGKIAHGKDDLTMDNFYLGSPNSRYFINVYDKKLEREHQLKMAGDEKKKRIEEELRGIVSWTRLEVRFSLNYAQQFVGYILSSDYHLGFYITSFLNDKIVFLKPSCLDDDNNRSRLASDVSNHARWWRKYLRGSSKLRLTNDKPEKMLIESKDWLFNQVSTTLAQLAIYKPLQFYEMIDDLVLDGRSKLKKEHLLRIKNQQYFDEKAEQNNYEYSEEIKRAPRDVTGFKKVSKEKLMDIYNRQSLDQVKFETLNKKKSTEQTVDF